MAKLKLHYDNKLGRVELLSGGSQIPIATLYPEDFSDFLWQINTFVEANSPNLTRKRSVFATAYQAAIRKDAWKWIGGVVKEKVSSMFGVK